jgi:hypothetical protein
MCGVKRKLDPNETPEKQKKSHDVTPNPRKICMYLQQEEKK